MTCSVGNTHRRLVGLAPSGSTERRRAIVVSAEITAFQAVVRPLTDGRGSAMDVVCPVKDVVWAEVRPENVLCLFQILMSNSLDCGGDLPPSPDVNPSP